jgi:hypothetical protein
MVSMRDKPFVISAPHEPTFAGRARHSVRAAAQCNVDCIGGAQGTARPTVAQRFMVSMRDNSFAINALHEPPHRKAGFIRQNRARGFLWCIAPIHQQVL